MNEQEWLECQCSDAMLDFLIGRGGDRKFRLFACACCRTTWSSFPAISRNWNAIAVTERYADGCATKEELKALKKTTSTSDRGLTHLNAFRAAKITRHSAVSAVSRLAFDPNGYDPGVDYTPTSIRLTEGQQKEQSALLRDIFGNPFRPVTIDSAWLTWSDSTVRGIAQAIYDERSFDRLPILPHALEDAGCDISDILNHCRGNSVHVPGCWVVDLLLGKG